MITASRLPRLVLRFSTNARHSGLRRVIRELHAIVSGHVYRLPSAIGAETSRRSPVPSWRNAHDTCHPGTAVKATPGKYSEREYELSFNGLREKAEELRKRCQDAAEVRCVAGIEPLCGAQGARGHASYNLVYRKFSPHLPHSVPTWWRSKAGL